MGEFEGADVEACWNNFKDKIGQIYPHFTGGGGKALFMRKETIKLINKKKKLFSVYRRTNRLIDLDRYKLVRNQVNSAIRSNKVSETKAKRSSLRKVTELFMDM